MKKNLKRIIASMSAAAAMGSYICAPMSAPAMLSEAPAFTAAAAEEVVSGDYSYTTTETGNACITKYTGTATELTIPSEIDGLAVEAIGGKAFSDSALTSAVIPSSVRTISSYAFRGSKNLKSVKLQEGLETIGTDAFVSTALTEIDFPASVKSCDHPFSGCNISKINFGENITAIPSYSFQGITGLTEVTIPDTVTNIGSYAFRSCKNLKSVRFQEGLEVIGSDAFVSTALTEIDFPASVKECDHPFDGCNISKINFGKNITAIPSYAFEGIKGLTEVTIPSTVSSIGSYTFRSCKELKSVTLQEGLEYIGADAFVSTALTEIDFPASVKSCDHPFYGCNISKINFGKNITAIPSYAFEGLKGLTEVTIPDTVTNIGSYTFRSCKELKSVTLQEGLAYIGANAFVSTALTEIDFPASVKECIHPFDGCNISKINFGKNIPAIPAEAFEYIPGLTEVTIPPTVSSIGSYAFRSCKNLKSVTLQEGLEYIGTDTFIGTALTEIYLPASVTTCNHPFAGCNINKISFGKNISTIPTEAFQDVLGLTEVTIPETVANIGGSAFRYCKDLKTVNFSEGLEYIGAYAFQSTGLTELTLPSTAMKFGDEVFSNCQSLKTAEIKSPIKKVPSRMFENDTALRTVTLPDTTETISNSSFYNCTRLSKINTGAESVGFSNSSSMGKCYALKDQRFSHLDRSVSDLKANKTKCEPGDTIDLTITYAFPEEYLEASEASNITIGFPTGVTLVSDSFEMEGNEISLSNAAKGSIPVTGKSGTLKFKAKINQAGEKIITADLTHSTLNGKTKQDWVSPIGIIYINSESEDEPVVTTTTTAKPVTTTTTKAPFTTTKAPAPTTTKAPVTTTKAPAPTTTKAPVTTTKAPAPATTKAPVTSTKPVTTTEEPTLTVIPYTSSTKNPVSTTKPVTTAAPVTTAPAKNPPTFGDPDNDGSINASDATFVLVEYSNLSTGAKPSLDEATFRAADVNKDGAINASDASLILQYYAFISTGNTESFEVFIKITSF